MSTDGFLNRNEIVRVILKVNDCMAIFAACTRSASANTIRGDLPPSSSLTSFRLDLAAACNTSLPVLVEPVKLIFLPSLSAILHDQRFSIYRCRPT